MKANSRHGFRLHPLPVRIMHWVNAAAMIIMIMSGWKIYNDEVIFGWLHFSDAITLGRWAQHGLQWHFFGMWILTTKLGFKNPKWITAIEVTNDFPKTYWSEQGFNWFSGI